MIIMNRVLFIYKNYNICVLQDLELKRKSKVINESIELRELEQQTVICQNIVLEKKREEIDKVLVEREKIEANLKTELEKCKETTAVLSRKVNKGN